ncbi:hypothetical protein GLOIN_2v1849317 [Rhizophagus irregularis DAOM 181602=DAOM 197198]|nr:hypothetical protein GLOIN_2v1849317 [Rhizophagus irregularis DAOM 181602=DAOM 197198]
MARRKELRKQSETTKSQAKILIAQFYPLISLPNLELMLQRAPRIYSGVKTAINFENMDQFGIFLIFQGLIFDEMVGNE